MTEQHDLPAGKFSAWLQCIRNLQIKKNGVDVPCGDCTACCRSSYFIHIRPEESETLARIPDELLFTAPGLPKGNLLMGYDENGHCPMLIENKCSIYDHRPLTCRAYDCRIFSATGIVPSDENKALITQHSQRWKFNFPTVSDRNQYSAVQAAAKFLIERAECFPIDALPSNETQLAIIAIKVYDVFYSYFDESSQTWQVPSDVEVVKAIMETIDKFESTRKEY